MANYIKDAKESIKSDAEYALLMCKETAERHQIEEYWVVEQFIKEFCNLVKEA